MLVRTETFRAATGPSEPVVILQYLMASTEPSTQAAGTTSGNLTNASLTVLSANQGLGYASDPVLLARPANTAIDAASAVSTASYFSFTVTPSATTLGLTTLAFDVAKGGSSGPRGWVLRSSIDSYAANIATEVTTAVRPTFESESIDLSGVSFQGLDGAITFRLYVFGQNTTVSLEIDTITLNGTVE